MKKEKYIYPHKRGYKVMSYNDKLEHLGVFETIDEAVMIRDYFMPEKGSKFDDSLYDMVIHYFYNNHENTDHEIAKYFKITIYMVHEILNDHLNEKIKRLNKRKYEDIVWDL